MMRMPVPDQGVPGANVTGAGTEPRADGDGSGA